MALSREALRLMPEHDEVRRLERERLRDTPAKGDADLSAGRFTTIDGDEELAYFFARLCNCTGGWVRAGG